MYPRGIGTPDDILKSTMPPDDYASVRDLPVPLHRLEAALARIGDFVSLPPAVVERLRGLYAEHLWQPVTPR